MVYENPYDLIQAASPETLGKLSEEAKEILRCCLDYEPIALVWAGRHIVKVVDTISGERVSSESLEDFIRESVEYAIEEAALAYD